MEMHNKIKELTEKIRQEGLEKANSEAEQIINGAKAEAQKLVKEAKDEAEKIREKAKKDAGEFEDRVHSEMKISQQNALSAFKKEITELILAKVVEEPLEKSLDDKAFISDLLASVVKNWRESTENMNLQILLPPDQLEKAEGQFRKKINQLMNNGLEVKEFGGISKGFEIQPKNGNYKISMTDEAFEEFFKEHFKPKTIEFLFGDKK